MDMQLVVRFLMAIVLTFSLSEIAAAAWYKDTLDQSDTGDAGHYTSIAVDSKNNPHMSYLDSEEKYVKYAMWNGADWSIDTIGYAADPDTTTLASGGINSIALDGNDFPHVCYFQHGVGYHYANWNGDSWNNQILPLGDLGGFYECSIAVDKASGVAHVSMLLLGGYGYYLGYWNSASESTVVVDDGGIGSDNGWQNAIALDSSGNPHISYEDRGDPSHLKYAYWNGSSWNTSTVAEMSGIYWEHRLTSIALDSNDRPHIAYYQDGYKYVMWNGSSWTKKSVPYQSGYPSLALALDSKNIPHIALIHGNSDELKYARLNGSSWAVQTIEDDSYHCDIALDNTGNAHISYGHDFVDSVLKYATTTKVTVLSPNGGETLLSGSPFPIEWSGTPDVKKYSLKYSYDNGLTWQSVIPGFVTGTRVDWSPIPPNNKKQCLIQVVGYNDSNVKVGSDRSNSKFTIEVVALTSPNGGGDPLISETTHTITWGTNSTIRPAVSVKLYCTTNGGTTWKEIDPAVAKTDTGSYDWTVPAVTTPRTKCKVKVVLKDSAGKTVGSDTSDANFTIQQGT
jgi:hypothetical protein